MSADAVTYSFIRPVFLAGEQLARQRVPLCPRRRHPRLQLPQHALPALIIDGAPIVGVDYTQIQELRALIGIGHARGGDLEEGLGE